MSILAAYAVPHPPLILSAIGKGREREIAATIKAFHEVMAAAAKFLPDTVVIISPHSEMYGDYIHISPSSNAAGDLAKFGAPDVSVVVDYDEDFVAELAANCKKENIAAGTYGERQPALDHATMIPIAFLSEHIGDHASKVKFVRIGVAGLAAREHYRLGQAVKRTAYTLGRRTVVIASSDLSHKLSADGPYGLAAEGAVFDKLCTDFLATGDFLSLLQIDIALAERAGHCGLPALWIMAGTLDGLAVQSGLLHYEAPFGVGYAVASFLPANESSERELLPRLLAAEEDCLNNIRAAEDAYVKLARQSVEYYLERREILLPSSEIADADDLLNRRAGVFVSLKKDGRLRGCIGTFLPTRENIANEIINNAVSAAMNDNRFSPVTLEEISQLVYNVDILSEPEAVYDIAELNPKRYGVIVIATDGVRRGLLLPALEGIDDINEQLSIARSKGNIKPDEGVAIYKFTVERHQ